MEENKNNLNGPQKKNNNNNKKYLIIYVIVAFMLWEFSSSYKPFETPNITLMQYIHTTTPQSKRKDAYLCMLICFLNIYKNIIAHSIQQNIKEDFLHLP